MNKDNPEEIREVVRMEYGKIAVQSGSCCSSTSCCGNSSPDLLANIIGYTTEELSAIPEQANMGLSCGNPTAIASLKPGEVVLDLGSGAGFDVFIAARKVGDKGQVIGVDMTPEMIAKARRNIDSFRQSTGLNNVEFRLGEIEHLPVADASIDIVISNCVINLSPDKEQVWRDISRVLKPGGRVCISDIVILTPLPETIRNDLGALIGCISGASLLTDIQASIEKAGLYNASFVKDAAYINQIENSQDSAYLRLLSMLPESRRLSEYVTSMLITAEKPI